ncbi:hypothetical protein [Chitinophaga sp. YIM B06452]|uniref:hypothetical protein n=1 Tax=Chitinophaga sp. YIM B06452 TaxID=3082158 RepID=UPI0031FE8E16
MNKQVDDIVKSVNRIGLEGEQHRAFIEDQVKHGKPQIIVCAVTDQEDGNSLLTELNFSIDYLTGKYHIDRYRVHVQQPMVFPDVTINGISVRTLHNRMENVNWGKDFKDAYLHFFDDTLEKIKENSPIIAILKDLWKLSHNDDPAGIEFRDKLMFKFLLETPFEKYHDLSHLKNRFSAQKTYSAENLPKLSTAYKELVKEMNKGRFVPRRPRLLKQQKGQSKGMQP